MITDTVCEGDPNNLGDPDKHKNVRNPPKKCENPRNRYSASKVGRCRLY